MNLSYMNFDNIIKSNDFLVEYEIYKEKINYHKLIEFLDNLENNIHYQVLIRNIRNLKIMIQFY